MYGSLCSCSHSAPTKLSVLCSLAESFKEWITTGKNAAEGRQILERMMEGVGICCVYNSYACTYACVCVYEWMCAFEGVGLCVCAFPVHVCTVCDLFLKNCESKVNKERS